MQGSSVMSSLAYGKVDYSQSPDDIGYENIDMYSEMDAFMQSADQRVGDRVYVPPYVDHNYAADLPCVSRSEGSGGPGSSRALVEPLASFIDIEDVSCNTTVTTGMGGTLGSRHRQQHRPQRQKGGLRDSDDQYEGSVTRCICDFQHDDGFMICCDRCGVWQHVVCMGLDKNNIPEIYLCELCNPRLVDKRRAIRIQTQKREEMDTSTDSSSEGRLVIGKQGGVRGRKRGKSIGSSKDLGRKRRRTVSKGEESGNESSTPVVRAAKGRPPSTSGGGGGEGGSGGKRSRRQSSGERSAARTLDHRRNITIDHSSTESTVQSHTSSYSNEVLKLITSKRSEGTTGSADGVENLMTVMSSGVDPQQLREQTQSRRFRVSLFDDDEAKGLESMESIRINQAVAEYTGNVMLRQEYERNERDVYDLFFSFMCDINLFNTDKSFPFVLCYAGLDSGAEGSEVCIDASTSSNDARYVRCSCTPNAKVLHVLDQNSIRFYICATKNIPEGREVTVPFYFDYRKGLCEVKCACGRPACPVMRFFSNRSSSRAGARSKRKSMSIDSTSISEQRPVATTSTKSTEATPTGAPRQRRKSRLSEPADKDLGGTVIAHDVGGEALPVSDNPTVSTESERQGSNTRSQATGSAAVVESRAALTNAIEKTSASLQSTSNRKTREQKKIEAVEKAFEKIERVNSREAANKKDTTATSTPPTRNRQQQQQQATSAGRGKSNHSSDKVTEKSATPGARGWGGVNNRQAVAGRERGAAGSGAGTSNGNGAGTASRASSRTTRGLRSLAQS